MKKKFLIVVLLLLFPLAMVSAKEISPKFIEEFFPNNKISSPTDLYMQITKYSSGNAKNKGQYIYLWYTQPDDILKMFNVKSELDSDDKFQEKYGCIIQEAAVQIDLKLDDGAWHYDKNKWDVLEYQDEMPYYLIYYRQIWASESQKSYREQTPIISSLYGNEDQQFLSDFIKEFKNDYDENDYYLDLDNHTLTFRIRYVIHYRNDKMTEEELDANNRISDGYLYSDWSEEVSIGKNGKQKELTKPEKIEAPDIKNLQFVEGKKENGTNYITWKVFVDFPKSNGEADKYYAVYEDNSDALNAVIEYRKKDGEWKETYWGNSTWLLSGWKAFTTEDVSKEDTIEFRVHLENNVEPDKKSPYSKTLVSVAGESKELPNDENELTSEKTCMFNCAFCCTMFLGISICIWIIIAIILLLLIVIICLKSKKRKKTE